MGRPFKTKKRFMGDDGLWYYRCSTCEEWKSEDKMGMNRNKPFNIDAYCKECKNERLKSYNKKKSGLVGQKSAEYNSAWIQPTGRHLQVNNVCDEDYRELEEYFIKMGYDITQPIHKQFGKRIEDKYGVILEFDDIPYQDKEKD